MREPDPDAYYLIEEFPSRDDCDPQQVSFNFEPFAREYYGRSTMPERTLYRVTNGNREYPPILSTEEW